MDDSLIIGLYLQRSETAIKETEEKYGALCRRVARNILNSRLDVEECINDSYLALWNSIPPAHPDSLISFLLRITKNLALKKVEYLSAEKRNPDRLISMTELGECLPDSNCPEKEFELLELRKLINSFLYSLDNKSRRLFIRRYWYFDSISDIASDFSMTNSCVKSILFRIRKKMKKYLESRGVDI